MSSLNDAFENNIKTLINSAKSVDGLTHQGLKGTAREEYLAEFLEKYLPHQWGVGKGQIQDSLGAVSNESDLIIYDRNSLPPTLIGKSINIFPIECVKYVFEVKSTLRSGEVSDTIKKFINLKSLYVGEGKKPVRVLFGFNSDLTKKSELERVKELDEDFNLNPAIQVLIVIGKGYWSTAQRRYKMVNEKKIVTTNIFYRLNPSPDSVELKSFLFAVLDTLNPDLPSFSKYFKIPAGVDSEFHEEYNLFVKEEPYTEEKEDLSSLVISGSLINSHVKKSKKKRSVLSLIKKKSKSEKEYDNKYIIGKSKLFNNYRIPLCQIEISNNGNKKHLIKSIKILTSKGLGFFINMEDETYKFPITINPGEIIKLASGFLCFKKHKDSNSVGGFISYRKGDLYSNHFYNFNDKMRNIDYGVIELISVGKNTKYSEEFQLTDFITLDENNDLDFVIDYNAMTHLFSENSDHTKTIISSHKR